MALSGMSLGHEVNVVLASSAHGSVHGDFNGDGYADLAIGIPNGEEGLGAVIVMYGSATGLTTAGSQLWTLDTPGVAGPRGVAGGFFGGSLAAGQFNGDRYADLAIGAPGQNGVLVLYGSSHGLHATGSQFLHGSASSGFALATGDFNGDGYDDLAVGQPFVNIKKNAAVGSVEVHYGSRTGLGGVIRGTAQLWTESTPGVAGPGPATNDNFGVALASGHFRGHRFADLAIGVPNSQGDGAVIVLNGSTTGLTATGSKYLESYATGGGGGEALAAGDFNGDGNDDLAVASPNAKTSSGNAGAVELHYGAGTGLRNVTQSTAPTLAEASPGMPGPPTAEDDKFAYSMCAADFNGDGVADLALGIPGKSSAIALFGSARGITTRGSQYLQGVGPQTAGSPLTPLAVATAAGDFNGAGYADLAFGEPFTDTSQPGAGVIEVHGGSSAGLLDSAVGTAPLFSESTPGMPGPPAGAQDDFGFALAGAGGE